MTPATGSLGETPPAVATPSEHLEWAHPEDDPARLQVGAAVRSTLERFVGIPLPLTQERQDELLATVRARLEELGVRGLATRVEVSDLRVDGTTITGRLVIEPVRPAPDAGPVCTCSYDESEEMTRHAPLCQVCQAGSEFK